MMPAKQPPTWSNEKRKLGELKKWPDNPRYSTKDDAAAIVESYEDFGQTHLLLISPDNELYDGHQRLDSWLAKYGADFVVDVRVSSYRLSDKQRRKLVADLHVKATGTWNWDVLAGWDADELKGWGFDKNTLKEWNNDANNLKEMLAACEGEGAGNDAEPEIDKAGELQEKWQTATGQLWAIGEHRLLCGDSTRREDMERAMGGDVYNLITDPPYGIDAASMTMGSAQSSMPKTARLSNVENWDGKAVDVSVFVGLAKYACVWGANYLALGLPVSDDWLCWDKKNPNLSFSEFELAWSNFGTRCRIFSHNWSGEKKQHITQKPLPVTEWVLSLCPDKSLSVLDPFGGSGTTMVACQNLGRKCRMIEISPAYCAVILERMAQAFPGIDIHLVE